MFRSILSSAIRVGGSVNRLGGVVGGTPIRFLSSTVNTGSVKWFDVKKGFGFITPDDGADDIFVHQTAIHAEGFRSLAEGEPVEYTTVTQGNGKVRAENVTGPMGAYVQGAPRNMYGGGGGFGGGGGGGFGGGGFGGGGGQGGYGGGGGGFGRREG